MPDLHFRSAKQLASDIRRRKVGCLEALMPYIAMERLDGYDLSEHLRQHRRLGLKGAMRMVEDGSTSS